MAGEELGVTGAPGGWDVLSSEKSCLITSKKLLNGLPTQTGRKEKRDKQMNNEVNERKRVDSGMWGGRGEEPN